MKSILRILALCLLLLVPSMALGDDAVSCYWQLESISVSTEASQAYGPAKAYTDTESVSGLDARGMTAAVRGVRSASLDLTRASMDAGAHAEYTMSGMPARVPGSASARLSLTAVTSAEEDSFYLYSAVYAGGKRTLRYRNTGAWVHRVSFPRTAVPGTTQDIRIVSREMNNLARVDAM